MTKSPKRTKTSKSKASTKTGVKDLSSKKIVEVRGGALRLPDGGD